VVVAIIGITPSVLAFKMVEKSSEHQKDATRKGISSKTQNKLFLWCSAKLAANKLYYI